MRTSRWPTGTIRTGARRADGGEYGRRVCAVSVKKDGTSVGSVFDSRGQDGGQEGGTSSQPSAQPPASQGRRRAGTSQATLDSGQQEAKSFIWIRLEPCLRTGFWQALQGQLDPSARAGEGSARVGENPQKAQPLCGFRSGFSFCAVGRPLRPGLVESVCFISYGPSPKHPQEWHDSPSTRSWAESSPPRLSLRPRYVLSSSSCFAFVGTSRLTDLLCSLAYLCASSSSSA